MVWKIFGITFLVMSILQGVSLLVLESSVCLDSPVLQWLEAELPRVRERYGDECEWGLGFRLGITAVVFWFVAGVLMFVIPAPEKPGLNPAEGAPATPSEEQKLDDAAAAAAVKEDSNNE
jgi:hypothetical protein